MLKIDVRIEGQFFDSKPHGLVRIERNLGLVQEATENTDEEDEKDDDDQEDQDDETPKKPKGRAGLDYRTYMSIYIGHAYLGARQGHGV